MDLVNEKLANLETQMNETREVVLLLQGQEEVFRKIQAEDNDESTEDCINLCQRLNVAETILANLTSSIDNELQAAKAAREAASERMRRGFGEIISRRQGMYQRLDACDIRITNQRRLINNLRSGIKFLLESNYPNFTNAPEYAELARTFNVRRRGGKRKKTKRKKKKTKRKRGRKSSKRKTKRKKR